MAIPKQADKVVLRVKGWAVALFFILISIISLITIWIYKKAPPDYLGGAKKKTVKTEMSCKHAKQKLE